MRRRLSLYIEGQKADLSNDDLILFNYQVSDIYNPAAVKNSYSQDIELPGTATNDAIFGGLFKADSVVSTFDPSKRASFIIYNEMNEILVSGYCKLNQITEAGGVHTYALSLFGGLGDFLYGLSMKTDGSKMSLADLDYLGGGDTELDFVINATNVQEAWDRLGGDNTKPEMWDVINFAPSYNGIPENFNADKALAKAEDFGLELNGNNTQNGYSLIALSEPVDEWAAKDLRSYLQRPVISMAKIMAAIANSNNNGGWSVDYSDINSIPYLNTWLTRPLLPSLGTYKQETGDTTITYNSLGWGSGTTIGQFLVADAPAGTEVNARLTFELGYKTGSSVTPLKTFRRSENQSYTPDGYYQQIIFVQAVGYASDNSKVCASKVYSFYKSYNVKDAESLATELGYTPDNLNTDFAPAANEHSYTYDGSAHIRDAGITMDMSGTNMARIDIVVTAYAALIADGGSVYTSTGGTSAGVCLFDSSDNLITISQAAITSGTATATTTSGASLRSGATITKQMLLSTSKTPAEYLISFCKAFGLYLIADSASKSVQILKRESFYQNETIDLSDRVDRTHEIQTDPIGYSAKWYELKHESVGGRFAEEYERIEGVQYGIERVDTGYDFDSEAQDLLSGSAFKSAVPIRDRNKYYTSPYRLVSPAIQETNGFYIAPAGQIAQATASWLLGKVHITYPGYYTFGTNLNNPNYNILAEYADSTYAYQVRVVEGPGTPTTITHFLTPGYYAIASDGNANFDLSGKVIVPSPFLNPGNTYTLWDANGDPVEQDVPQAYLYDWLNQTENGYDICNSRTEFRDAENKGIDGADVLLHYSINTHYDNMALTDDIALMDTLNGGPCWLWELNTGMDVPTFSRYGIIADHIVVSLDFAVPRQVDIPALSYGNNFTIGYKAFNTFLADRLNVDNKVMRCRVDLSGLQVGVGLLRKFYWYRNTLWTLTKISNHSLTTFDPAECEFVQVRDITNYTSGQY